EDGEAPAFFQETAIEETAEADDADGVEDEAEEQAGQARQDQGGGERRPRRRGRRGGRRRRRGEGGPACSVSDEAAPPPPPEAATAVADFDGLAPASQPESEPVAAAVEASPVAELEEAPEPVEAPAPEQDKHAPRRSTVREKVSFAPHPADAVVPVAPPAAE